MFPNSRRLLRERALLRARARRAVRASRALSRRVATAAASVAAAANGHLPSVLTPLVGSGLVEQTDSEGPATAAETTEGLLQAIQQGNHQLVHSFLHDQQRWRGAAATAAVVSSVANENGDACIHVAAKLGHAEIVSLLLHHGAETSHLGSRSRTPLQLASIYGHLQAVEALLDAGADANASLQDASGYEHWALSFASRMGHVDVLKALLRHGADVMQSGTRGLTALHYAAVRNQANAVYALVEAGANIEAHVHESGGGGTPLHASAVMRCYDAALALLTCGAKVESTNAFGYTPLHGVARQGGKDGAVGTADLLLRWGADETAMDRDGNRPIDVVGHSRVEDSRAEEDNGRQKGEVDRLCELLQRAPRDRAWRRRGYIVLCRVFFVKDAGKLQEQTPRELLSEEEFAAFKRHSFLAGEPYSRLSKARDPENSMWSELAMAEMAPQTPQPFASSAISPPGNGDAAHATLKLPASGRSGVGELNRTADGDLRAVLIRLLDFPEEGVFRNTVSFL